MTPEVCFVTAYPPGRRELGGGGWVDRRLHKTLRDTGMSVDLISVTGPEGEWTEHGYTGVSAGAVPLEMRSSRAGLFRIAVGMLCSTEPYLSRKFTVFGGWPRAVELLRERAAGKPVVTSGWPALLLAEAAGIEVAAHIAHNVESAIAEEHSPAPLRLLGERPRLRSAERRLLSLPHKVFALSRTDRVRLASWNIHTDTLPLPVMTRVERKGMRPRTVGFIGKASWPPNAVALRALLGPVHEALYRLGVDVDYVLAGRGTEAFANHPRVLSSGWVADEAEFYAGTGLLVVPRFGASTGISVKMIEAAEHGVVSVVPPELAEAVDPAGPWIVANDSNAIAEAVAAWSLRPDDANVFDWVSGQDPGAAGAVIAAALTESEVLPGHR
ncbi:MAG: glycosyltransferase [Kutzneria sp.]|nr:glycosyltransferase [Kutzneria sp.]